jgi:carbon starvation protein
MSTLVVAVLAFVGFIVAYHTYGRWLARRIFGLDPDAVAPSQQLRDNVDFIPTRKEVIFGHHFTSIAGTGPIVGPAIAVFWGWLPALLWVVFGSIFIGAVHDFGALVVSLRNRGQTVGEVAGRMISPRAKILFLLILFFALTVVLAIFGLVIASIFKIYPESVLSVWIAMPVAVLVGYWVYRRGSGLLMPSLLALAVVYGAVWVGTEYLPLSLESVTANLSALGDTPEAKKTIAEWASPTILWTAVLFVYCFIASVLPVWVLLQPRDFINSHQLIVALVLLCAGIFYVGVTGKADLIESAPAVVPVAERPFDAPPIWPFLFITIACGAISGFHCLVSSGTTSKQIANESDAQYVAYGAMLLEGALAVIVILACCAGLGMGQYERQYTATDNAAAGAGFITPYELEEKKNAAGEHLTGMAAWRAHYDLESGWAKFRLGQMVGAFVDGGANFVHALGLPIKLSIGIIAVLVACFAATTLDTATRLQRYVVQELAASFHIKPLENKYLATGFAVTLALLVAVMRGPSGAPGTGGLYLWPLFGATNQLLAGMAFMVTVFYLWRRKKPIWFAAIPMVIMIVLPVWALSWQMFNEETGWYWRNNYLLFSIGAITMGLQIWMVCEAILMWTRAKGVLEESLPPLAPRQTVEASGGRSC